MKSRILIVWMLCCAFSLTMAAQTEAQKMILVEQFGNTYCPPCIFKNAEFNETILGNYEDTKVLHIYYHVDIPIPNDVYYQHNPVEAEERKDYYTVLGTPNVFLSGRKIPVSDVLLPEDSLIADLGQSSAIGIEMNESINGNTKTVTINLRTLGAAPTGAYKLRAMVVEKYITAPPPFEGMESEHHNTFRLALNGTEGATYVAPPTGISTTYTYQYEMNSEWNAEQIYVVAFIQNEDTHEILNAGSTWTGLETVGVGNVVSDSDVLIYPNPVQDMLTIDYPSNVSQTKISVLNTLGQTVIEQFFEGVRQGQKISIDLAHLPIGSYFLKMEGNGQQFFKKIIKQ